MCAVGRLWPFLLPFSTHIHHPHHHWNQLARLAPCDGGEPRAHNFAARGHHGRRSRSACGRRSRATGGQRSRATGGRSSRATGGRRSCGTGDQRSHRAEWRSWVAGGYGSRERHSRLRGSSGGCGRGLVGRLSRNSRGRRCRSTGGRSVIDSHGPIERLEQQR